jgi:hypothetical protein
VHGDFLDLVHGHDGVGRGAVAAIVPSLELDGPVVDNRRRRCAGTAVAARSRKGRGAVKLKSLPARTALAHVVKKVLMEWPSATWWWLVMPITRPPHL